MCNAFKSNVCDCTFYKVAVTNHTKNKNATKKRDNKFIQVYVFTRTPFIYAHLRKHLYVTSQRYVFHIY